jgi:hypothetical protein
MPVREVKKDGEGGSSKAAFAAFNSKVTQVKQYLVAKMISGLKSHAVELIPLPGLYTLGAAEEFVAKAMASEPQTKYVIQEVGTA